MPDMIYLPAMFSSRVKENPFKKQERLFPVNFGHRVSNIYQAEYLIPEGFEVESIPESISLAMPNAGGKFNFMVEEKNEKLVVLSKLLLRKPEFQAEEYVFLK